MNLLDQLTSTNIIHPTAIFQLKNGDFVIASFKENEEEAKTLLLNPFSIITIDNGEGLEGLSLEPYLNKRIVRNPNFFIDTGDIFSVHPPTEELFAFYIANVMKHQSFDENPTTGKGKKKPKSNTANGTSNTITNVINVDFAKRANTTSLVNIYPEGTLFIDLNNDDPSPNNAA